MDQGSAKSRPVNHNAEPERRAADPAVDFTTQAANTDVPTHNATDASTVSVNDQTSEKPRVHPSSELHGNRANDVEPPRMYDEIRTPAEKAERTAEYVRANSARNAPPGGGTMRTQSYATDASATTGDLGRSSTGASGIVDPVAKLEQERQGRKWYRKLNPLRFGPIPPLPKERIVSREARASWLSRLTFSWIAPLMHAGYRRPLEPQDIWLVNPRRACEPLAERLQQSFDKRVAKGEKHPLIWAIHETMFHDIYLGGLCNLLGALMQSFSPFVLRFLIQFATDAYNSVHTGTPAPHIGRGLGLAFGISCMLLVQTLCMNQFFYKGMMVGGQSRAALISMIYSKAMVLSERARAGGQKIEGPSGKAEEAVKPGGKKNKKTLFGKNKQETSSPVTEGWENGRIVNLMSVDTYRIDQAAVTFHILWSSPLLCVITLVLLLINISYSALAGFALLVLGVPLLARAIHSLFRRRKLINESTDKRVGLTQEILQNVRFVKYFGWEMSFLNRLRDVRATEIKDIRILMATRNAINAISMSLPVFASMLSFITYSQTHNKLTPASVFSSLALFNALRFPLNMLPLVLGLVIDAWSSVNRIEQFLLAEEVKDEAKWEPDGANALELRNAFFTWEKVNVAGTEESATCGGRPKSTAPVPVVVPAAAEKEKGNPDPGSGAAPFELRNLNLTIGRSELVAVIGSVGSGKSSLLSAMAGDMRRTNGDLILGASRALCPQHAWIQNTTVRDNILFGKEMDRSWYDEVVEACALKQDMEMLPGGDLTEIGERGITISGGQKQRLNIARAIYFDSDLVIMDDPLSAVDAHVGRHIFDNAILGLLKDKARVLATHQLWVLARCDRIVWMENGEIQAVDTFDNLMRDYEAFRTLLESTAKEKTEEEEDSDVDDDDNDDIVVGGLKPKVNQQSAAEKRKQKKQKKAKEKVAALMQAEEHAVSSVPWSTYATYLRSSGSIINGPLVLLIIALSQALNIVTSLWLSWWTGNKYKLSTSTYIGVYAALGVSQSITMFGYAIALTMLGTAASQALLRKAIMRVLRAPMSFFDTTPLGRITNRFSRDIDVLDNNLSDSIRMFLFTLSSVLAVFGLIIAYFYWFAIALVPLAFLFIFAAAYYRTSARELKRIEAVLRSTVFAKFGEGLSGVASIRAYGLRERFVAELRKGIDEMNAAYYLTFGNQRWLSVRLDTIGNGLVLTTSILVVTSRFNVPPYLGGLVLSYILSIVQMMQFSVRQLAEVESGMNSVERMLHYGEKLEEEAPLHTIKVPPAWPDKGEIVFDNVQMRYRPALPLVLHGLNLAVRGGERIGIVGRTGAGKSSIMSALFRLVELSAGRITIDGIDISTIGLHDLRSRIAIIPQDPTLFKGTVRSNLDPFGEHTDMELWNALRQADLVHDDAGAPNAVGTQGKSSTYVPTPSTVSSSTGNGGGVDDSSSPATTTTTSPPQQQQQQQPSHSQPQQQITLDSAVAADGTNFSLGQRQMLALARALVRNARIIVCDEATSSVDVDTDARIQRTMAAAFRGRSLLVIAHRLRTILGYDRIVVLDAGRIAEVGSPEDLWNGRGCGDVSVGVDADGDGDGDGTHGTGRTGTGAIFRSMCERSGITEREILAARSDFARL